jgi:signal transduction histidine kinase/ligand-binding sensor domain-containing protein
MERAAKTTDAGMASITAGVLVCVLCELLCAPAFSLDRDRRITQFYYTFWNEKDGSPSQITALAQTEDGYLWIGSERGLFRFDGVRFEEYTPQSAIELPSYSVYALMATPDGGLWVAFSPTGLAFLKSGYSKVFTRDELPDSPVHCFARDREGRIWAGTEAGLVLRQGTRWVDIGQSWNLPREMIRYLLVDREGTLWVATIKRIAFLRQGSKRFELGGAVGTGLTKLAQAQNGRVWFAEDNRGEVRPVPLGGHNADSEFPAIAGKGLSQLLYDRDGALWITDMYLGIIRIRYPEELRDRPYGLHDPELELFDEKDGFSGGIVGELLEDREGNIWVGCSNGLIQFRHTDVLPVRLPEGYQRLTLLGGQHGGLWVGTISHKPLLHIQGENVLVERGAERVASVLRASNGDIWWGGRTGIWRQRGTEFRYFPLPKQTMPDWMWEIIPSRADGGLWIELGDVGFVHFNQGIWNLHAWPAGIPSVGGTFRYGPSANYVDEGSGQIWLGYTSGHVIVLDGARVTVYGRNHGLDVGRIKVIRGRGQHVWMGGELGLMFFSKRRFWRVRVAGGEPFDAISGIIETSDGGLWLNEMRGIVHIPAEEVRKFIADPNYCVTYRRFDYLDGLPGMPQMDFTVSSAIETSDGRLWFAADNGVGTIDPAHFFKNVVPPPVSIVSISNEKGRQPLSNSVKYPAGTHAVEIDYTALSFSMPERVKFRYKLEGANAEWQNAGTRRQAYYNNLGPGWYRFRVIACNNDGVWNNAGATLDFSIAPYFYQTLWFRAACMSILVLSLLMLYQLRLRTVRQRYLERSRAAEALRRAQTDLAHIHRVSTVGELTASLAHEINQPIGAAVTNAEACLRFLDRDQPDVADAREAALEMARDARRAANIIHRVRSLYGKGSSQREIVDVNEVIREMVLMLRNEANRYSITVDTALAENPPKVMADRVQLQQVLMNLMLNGIEAMRDTTGELSIRSLLIEDEQVLVSVTDTGVGLRTEKADQIFDAFFTTKPQGTGMGLAITRSIIEAHGGRVWATANSGRGTTFQFTLPSRLEKSQ